MKNNYVFNRKSVAAVLIFSVITFGIYFLYWIYDTTRKLAIYNEDYQTSPGLAVLFTIITCGIYGLYWWYKISVMFNQAQIESGVHYITDNKVLLVLLAVFGFSLISMGILQADLNRFWTNMANQTPDGFGNNTQS